MAFALNPNAPAKTGQTYFLEYGLRIPRYNKQGKEILHARSACELESLESTVLRRIVESYDRSKGHELVKTLKTDTAIAKWIERVETLAFGPHPESKLPSTEKKDLLIALRFKKAPQGQAKNDTPGKKLNPQKTASLPKVKAPQSQTKQHAPGKKPNPQKVPTKQSAPPVPSTERKKEQELAKPSPISLQGKAPKNKRKHATDDAGPSDAPQTPAKKKKKVATPAPKPESTDEFELDLEQALEQELAKPSPPPSPQVAPAKNKRKHDEHAALSNTPETPGKKRRTDAASPTASSPPPTTPQSPLLRSPTPHRTTNEAPSSPLEDEEYDPDEPPFRAPGLHGPHGSFPPSDPSLLTGRGHRVPPHEWAQNLDYQAHRYTFYNTLCPYYPFTDPERSERATEDNVPGLRELREMEAWMGVYRERWPGECVGHLWDCGCVNMGYYEGVGGGSVSEEE